jgi:hypothetical protein
MEIYTPNHRRFIDTLFTYGFIGVLERIIGYENLKRVDIQPMGDYYLIKNIDDITPKKFYKELLSAFKENYYGKAYKKNGQVLPLLGFQNEEKVIKKIIDSLRDLCSLRGPSLSEILFKRDESVLYRESPCKQHAKQLHTSMETLYLVSAPFLGKYHNVYNKILPEARAYKICSLCAGLIYLGLLTSSYFVKYNVRPPVWEYGILIPTKEGNAKQFIAPAKNRSEDTKQVIWCDEIPEIVLPILVLYPESFTFLEDVLHLSSTFYSYRLISAQKRIGVWAVRSTSEHVLENFIKFLLNIKLVSESNKLMSLVRDSLYTQAFTSLAFSIINKDIKYFYMFLRGLASNKKHYLIDDNFVNNALKFFLE